MSRVLGFVRRQPAASIGIAILAAAASVALLAPVVAPYGQTEQAGPPFGSPSGSHLLGLSDTGADIVSQLIYGARASLMVGFAAALVAAIVGGLAGLTAGYFGGALDTLIGRVTDYFLVFPVLPLAIVVAALWGPSLGNVILVIGLLSWPATARLVRAQVKGLRERVFVARARSLGARPLRILARHILPSVAPLLVAGTVVAVGNAVFFEAALAFLGLSDPSRISWGKMIALAFQRGAVSDNAWWAIVPPGLAIGVVVLGATLVGRWIEDSLNPRLRVGHLGVGRRAFRVVSEPDVAADSDGVVESRATPAALEIRGLHVSFDLGPDRRLDAVRGVDLVLGRGERLGLVGESGCGKTTTILAAMGLLPPNASVRGRVLVNGHDILSRGEQSALAHRWRDVAMVFQGAMNALNPVRTISRQIAEPMLLHDVVPNATAARTRARELLELVGIPAARAARYPHELSGGMRQRAAIAMALACDPKVLLADEPTTALDVMVQAQILRLLERLCDELGLALVLVTHDLPVVAEVCERAAVMYAGEIVEQASTDTLYHQPRHPYTARLFAATPEIGGTGELVSIPGAPPRLDTAVTGCPFAERCEHVFEPCPGEDPALIVVGDGHVAACHLNDPARRPAGVSESAGDRPR